MSDPDTLATLQAIDEAFHAHVAKLFGIFVDGTIDERKVPRPEASALQRFEAGLDLARAARIAARARFVRDGD